MPTSAAQISANQLNAQKSTGPITAAGKSIVANNAVKHGLFSKNLILADENPLQYENLLDQLQTELNPSGVLEQALVERIAVSLWRQQRLVCAETAYIELNRKPKNIVAGINQELGLTYSEKALTEKDMVEFDAEQYQWCQEVLKEYEAIDLGDTLNIPSLEKTAPLIHRQLLSDAEEDQETPADYLQAFKNPVEYFIDLAHYCQEQIKQAEQRPMVLEIAAMVKSKRAILQNKTREALMKYQVMLDNELYKAINSTLLNCNYLPSFLDEKT
jgi:hypothetical protein